MKQKILAFLGTVGVMMGFLMVMVPENVMADGGLGTGSCGAPVFLGFKPWYADLCNGDIRGDGTNGGSEVIQPTTEKDTVVFIWTVVLNILYDMFLAVGYLALGFVIYGGFLYITAQGDPGRAMKGQKTLTTAIIGTILTMSATVIVNTVKVVLGISGNSWNQGQFQKDQLQNAFNWAYTVAGIVAVIFIIKAGFEYVISRGDAARMQKAMRSIIYAVVGLVIVLLAAAITVFVINATSAGLEAQP